MSKYLLAIFALIFLSGCLSSDQHVASGPSIDNAIRQSTTDIKGTVAEKVADSQNSMQNNISSLFGVGIGKLADKLADVRADLTATITGMSNTFNTKIDKMENDMNVAVSVNNKLSANLENQMSANIELRNQIKVTNDMNASLMASLNATLKVNAELEAKVNAMANAVAGVDNKITQTTSDIKQTFSSGRDTIQNQLDSNALKAVQSGNMVAIIIIAAFAFCLAVLVVGYIIIKTHSQRADKAETDKGEMFKIVAKCMTGLTPEMHREISKDLAAKV